MKMILFDVKIHLETRYIASLPLDSYFKSAMPKVFHGTTRHSRAN